MIHMMHSLKKSQVFAAAFVFAALMTLSAAAAEPKASDEEAPKAVEIFTFEKKDVGELPGSWKADATNPTGPVAEWAIIEDKTASKGKALAITKIHDTSNEVFNLCFSPLPVFRDGEIELSIKPLSGKTDQGGGVVWRAKDAKNYYVARCNPLEPNLRLYCVKDGARKMIAEATGVNVRTGQWSIIKVVQRGEKIEVSLNGKKLIEAADSTFPEAGKLGFWTKADATSAFTDFKVTPEGEEGKKGGKEAGETVKGGEGKQGKAGREKAKAGKEKKGKKAENDDGE